jgi:hypothetical protein
MRADERGAAAAKLREAARIVRDVAALQNEDKHRCEHCGLDKAEDLPQARTAETLRGHAKKLENVARTIVEGGRRRGSPVRRPEPSWVQP